MTKVDLKFQIRLDTRSGWSQLTDEERSRVYSALMASLDQLGVEDRRNMYGPHWEEHNVSKSLTQCCWEIKLPSVIV